MNKFVQALLAERLWVLILAFFLFICSVGVLMPHVNPVSVSYFASQRAGHLLDCSAFKHGEQPEACLHGTADSTTWVAGASFVANSVLGLTLVPLTGFWSDRFGRKPFMLLGAPCSGCPSTVAGMMGCSHISAGSLSCAQSCSIAKA